MRRLSDELREIPIIALTASVMSEVREKAIKSGMNDLITKPFDSQNLRYMIEKYLDKSRIQFNQRLSSDLDTHSYGNPELRGKLILSAIQNLREIRNQFKISLHERTTNEEFSRVTHKTKMTVSFLKSSDLTSLIQQADKSFKSGNLSALTKDFEEKFESTLNKLIFDLQAMKGD